MLETIPVTRTKPPKLSDFQGLRTTWKQSKM
jgi:hypothetical protein